MLNFINSQILKAASKLVYTVSDRADFSHVFGPHGLVIWTGASEQTIFQDARVNWAFRAVHDAGHIESRLGFSIPEEVELAKRQAARFDSDLMKHLIFAEVALQAEYFQKTGQFVLDQKAFTLAYLKSKGFTK
jgi:hypothetical protein